MYQAFSQNRLFWIHVTAEAPCRVSAFLFTFDSGEPRMSDAEIVEAIEDFEEECQDYTDTDRAWYLFCLIKHELQLRLGES